MRNNLIRIGVEGKTDVLCIEDIAENGYDKEC
jgi:hypothetical protein